MTEETPGFTITDAPDQNAAGLAAMQRDLLARLASASVADAVGLMVRSERHRGYALADLEWLLLPPLALGQIMFAYQRPQMAAVKEGAESNGAPPARRSPPIASAMLTWALVSPEVAAKLDALEKAGAPLRLTAQEWRSGKQLRFMEAIGTVNDIRMLTQKLRQQLGAPDKASQEEGAAA
jgi:hemolysin-activating ACP:hemolysin acyltransferase